MNAEFVWRSVSEALDAVEDREAFLVRLVLLTALDHLDADQLTGLIAEARDAC
ncbi:hypothetical protein HUO13_19220 [Saccharopolyspora erythraea]|uniref:hypothetical protein n=1 Tax=Saccharopolyspora erythraea TaxID=1836 RepID=UPI001BA48F27|nr:hypothetical protein [Saccharopolyspora erythraea]QUH02645.1 hypothetical protein HUO13_19220 [Saccharopolyspora erythraea]